MKKLFVIMAAMVMALSANAQFANSSASSRSSKSYEGYSRINFGYDYRNYTFKYESESEHLSATHGGVFEYLRGINIVPSLPIYLEVGGRVSFNTGTLEKKMSSELFDTSEDIHADVLGISIPVNAAYKFNLGDGGFYIEPYAGMHFRFNVLAQCRCDGETLNLLSKDDMDDNKCKMFQFGGQVGVTMGINKFNFGLAYIMDTPFYSKSGLKIKNDELAATIGFTF